MVSLGSIALIGLGIILLGGTALKIRGPADLSPAPISDIPVQENPQIQILKDAIKGVQGFFSTTFKAPMLTKGLVTGGKQLPCRGPNCLGIFQAKGTRSVFDPFTGQRLAIGGSSKFQQITGSNFSSNLQRITQGNLLKTQTLDILADLKGQLKILETNSV